MSSTPITTRSGSIKSLIAVPSLRNSGFQATFISKPAISDAVFLSFSAVPARTVDRPTKTESARAYFASREVDSSTADRSTSSELATDGVPTHRKWMSISRKSSP